ncbi:MAG: TonB-dependent receptor plug domain-containing protein [Duncaniella sp.]|nr:TonB-dependent receptor plug domain-containing protein [Duncaniella sp.]
MKAVRCFRCALALAMISSVCVPAFADEPFNGLVLDSDLKPVKKVKVFNRDEQRYATSDKKGRFGLTDVMPGDTLTLIVKKRRINIPVDGKKSMKIILADETNYVATQDDELVNIGYGYVKRREFTGVSSGISGATLRGTGERSILKALVGLVPGLNISQNNGDMNVNIRGERSLMLSSTPLYIVDGVQVSSLDFISIYDVDHVEVLKDASQYGSRGANGAILVTTKSALERKQSK